MLIFYLFIYLFICSFGQLADEVAGQIDPVKTLISMKSNGDGFISHFGKVRHNESVERNPFGEFILPRGQNDPLTELREFVRRNLAKGVWDANKR